MKKILLSSFLILFILPSFAQEACLAQGEKCYSPFIQHTPCCEGLSCKATQHSYKCFPKECVGDFQHCNKKGAPCCQGRCVHGALSQPHCKPW